MTLDSPLLLYRPTDDLILPSHRKLFPIKIPNAHHQLRHYISTADAGRIYVAVGRIINAIATSNGRLDVITIVPFDPRCLTAGLGWIAVGGSDNGDCAFIKLRRNPDLPPSNNRDSPEASRSEVDGRSLLDLASGSGPLPASFPEVHVHEFGGSIVNSLTIHRLPDVDDLYAGDEVAVVTNNDHTVNVFSLSRQEILETLPHPTCMNYGIISPDSSVLAAVGDEHRVYFYRVRPCPKKRTSVAGREKPVCGWEFSLIRSVELESESHYNDRCCFTIAFSPSSHICAVGSQSGIITVLDVKGIVGADDERHDVRDDIVCVFRSSRASFEGGAVRSMSFSPRPWDLLVWVEEYGKVGVADVRQAFSRRQIINLELEDSSLERIHVENPAEAGHPDNSDSDSENRADYQLDDVSDAPAGSRRNASLMDTERQAVRENLSRELTDRERRIINFLNTAQWASTIEEGPQARLTRLLSPLPHSGSPQGSQTGNRSPLSSSPPDRSAARLESAREVDAGRTRGGQPRRRSSAVLSQDNPAPGAPSSTSSSLNATHSALVPRPSITLTWTESPSQVPRSDSSLETAGSNNAGPSDAAARAGPGPGPGPGPNNGQASSSSSSGRSQHGPHRARVLLDRSLGIPGLNASGQRQRSQRSRSIPRRSDRPDSTRERQERQDPGLATERLRLHRQAALEDRLREQQQRHQRELEEQQLRYLRESEQARVTPLLRRDFNDPSAYSHRDRERQRELGVGTAGIGWGEDGHTLYIGTVRGILQYQIDVQDRKTFPGVSFR